MWFFIIGCFVIWMIVLVGIGVYLYNRPAVLLRMLGVLFVLSFVSGGIAGLLHYGGLVMRVYQDLQDLG